MTSTLRSGCLYLQLVTGHAVVVLAAVLVDATATVRGLAK